MSFGVDDAVSGLAYRATNLNTLFAQRQNLLRPTIYECSIDIVRFYGEARVSSTMATTRRAWHTFLAEGSLFHDVHRPPPHSDGGIDLVG